ncbi:hypothetical protein EDD22DRAFT_851486 [Suillus occidentalis]|nr:hypothetical protein EDD22DRAFT_851486 [Suillus occidentalis]
MSTPVQTSLASLKASTVKLVGIIASAQHIPAGTGEAHNILTKQATTLLGEIIGEHEKGDYIPGIVASCSKELMRMHSMTPWVWPNWHSIGHDDPQVPLTIIPPSPAPVPPSAPILPSAPFLPSPPGIASTSGMKMSEFQDKGKGKAATIDLIPEVEGSRKRKFPMISGYSSQPPKSTIKGCKCVKLTQLVKSNQFMESEDEEDTIVQVPHSPGFPKKQNFGPASMTANSCPEVMKSPISHSEATVTSGSHLKVIKPTDDTAGTSDGELPTIPTFDIIIPSPIGSARLIWIGGLATPVYLASGAPPRRSDVSLHLLEPCPNVSESRAQTHSQSHGISHTLAIPAVTTPKVQSHGCSKTITGRKTPAPAPAPAPALAVPRAALDVPMPDLHSMVIAIRDDVAHITILEAHVLKQDGKIDTLQCLHESLQHQVINWHPSFPLLNSPANATFLLDQSVPPLSMSPLPFILPNLINLDMEVMEPTPLKVEDGSDMVGLMFEPSQVQPESPQTSGKIINLDDLGNLFPEYNSVSEMDVEVKAGPSGEEVEMAT